LFLLTKLKNLSLSRNKIGEVPARISDLTALDSLFLDGDFFNKPDKKIKTLPAEICRLKNLKKLTLKDNVIEHLPANIGDLSQLKALDVRGNLLEELPASITKLSKLEALDLKANELKSLPAGFTNLTSLNDLNISMNLNIEYPIAIPGLATMKSLRILDISYNNLTRSQAQPLIDGLPDCKIINLDYSKKALSDTPPEKKEIQENRPQVPGRH